MKHFSLLVLIPLSIPLASGYTVQCEELDIRKDIAVYIPNTKSPTTISHLYSLKRNSVYNYEVFLNLTFVNKSKLAVADIDQHFKKISQDCMDKFADTFQDESGRSITLTIYDSKKHGKILSVPPPAVTIAIKDKGYRSTSRAYEHNAGCTTFVHEYLHLTGLVDEYNERVSDGFLVKKSLYPDRALTNERSWMAQFSLGFMDTGIAKKKKRLYPGQLDAIVFPGCTTRNALYYSCAKYAYAYDKSADVPLICKQKTEWLKGNE